MARVTYGALITELQGSIGGITFQKNSSGGIARLKPNMPVNSSFNQQGQQIKLSNLISAWSNLSAANKISWENLASAHDKINEFGETKTLNGFQWFMSCNLNLLVSDQAIISAAPVWSVVTPPPMFTMSYDATHLYTIWTPSADFTGYRLNIYATTPLNQTSIKLRRSTFLIRKVDPGVLPFLNLLPWYSTVFNLTWADFIINSNVTIIVRIKKIQEGTGLSSPYTSVSIKLN